MGNFSPLLPPCIWDHFMQCDEQCDESVILLNNSNDNDLSLQYKKKCTVNNTFGLWTINMSANPFFKAYKLPLKHSSAGILTRCYKLFFRTCSFCFLSPHSWPYPTEVLFFVKFEQVIYIYIVTHVRWTQKSVSFGD